MASYEPETLSQAVTTLPLPWNGTSDSTPAVNQTAAGSTRSVGEIVVITALVGLLVVLTAGGNLLVMISFKMDKQLQNISNYFLLSLSVADFAIGIISMPLYTVYLLMDRWPLGPITCDIWLAIDYTMSNASVANLLLISFDRYFSVTQPMTYRFNRTTQRAVACIAIAWIISILLWTPWIFAWPHIEGVRSVPNDQCFIQFLKTNSYITVITAFVAFYLPVILMCILYYRIYMETENRKKRLKNILQEQQGGCQHRATPTPQRQTPTITEAPTSEHALASSASSSWSRRRRGNWWRKFCRIDGGYEGEESSSSSLRDSPAATFRVHKCPTAVPSKESPRPRPNSGGSMMPLIPTESYASARTRSPDTSETYTIVIQFPENSNPTIRRIVEESDEDETAQTSLLPQASITTNDSSPVRLPTEELVDRRPLRPNGERKQDRKAAKTLSAILLAFIITWTPYSIFTVINAFCANDCIPDTIYAIGYWMCYLNSTVNPICYALCNVNFRDTYWRILTCRWRKKRKRRALHYRHQQQVHRNAHR